ncbi:hypothetical protein [Fluviispira sanaruensis]|uniref:hypothetical protein n=1 Tax=Fluviispira sanaruensis TaxID=2493639 RepID=UPI001558A445|nr:hypothetical protein [Fluviispira sanaruensis]
MALSSESDSSVFSITISVRLTRSFIFNRDNSSTLLFMSSRCFTIFSAVLVEFNSFNA